MGMSVRRYYSKSLYFDHTQSPSSLVARNANIKILLGATTKNEKLLPTRKLFRFSGLFVLWQHSDIAA